MRIELQARVSNGGQLRTNVLRIDASVLAPDRLVTLTGAQISQLPLRVGRDVVPVGDLFSVNVDGKLEFKTERRVAKKPATKIIERRRPDALELRVRTEGLILDKLGFQMTSGRLVIEGDAGGFAGQQMNGGELVVLGNAGAYAGCEMRKGKLTISGNAGDFLASVQPGNNYGMRGGQIIVQGNVGERAGDRMRRGLVTVRGNAGAWAASRMVAGTLIVMGRVAGNPGFGMLHGTLICARQPAQLLPSFGDCGVHRFMFLRLLADSIKTEQPTIAARLLRNALAQRFAGDHAFGGKGELLVLQ